ncbi:hypothetical protein BGZ65_002215 [Modicella reniformis]|uniref:Uncharacterized protein n=1 Tax=Modicella reniformis TaxID=1440133 RepID=A0A9P6M9T1_9FUNG|nr:hypothetical protein BGZ65_002215 [Modicella reniformis]
MLFLKSILLACTAVVVVAQREYDALVSGTRLIGIDTTIPGQSGVDIFRHTQNHASAVASILLFAANRANFRPHQNGVITDSAVFGEFINQSTRFPAVRPQIEYGNELELNGDRHQLKEEIERTYHANVNHPQEIANALEGLIPSRLSAGVKSQVWVLSHITLLSEPHQEVAFELAYLVLKLVAADDNGGAVKVVPQSAHFSANAYRIDSDILIKNAVQFARQIPTFDVPTFLKELSTTRLTKKVNGNVERLEAWLDGKDNDKNLISGQSSHRQTHHCAGRFPSSQLRLQA